MFVEMEFGGKSGGMRLVMREGEKESMCMNMCLCVYGVCSCACKKRKEKIREYICVCMVYACVCALKEKRREGCTEREIKKERRKRFESRGNILYLFFTVILDDLLSYFGR